MGVLTSMATKRVIAVSFCFSFLLFVLLMSSASVSAASLASLKTGLWSDPSVWSLGRAPVAGDVVTVAAGHTVTYNVLSDAVLGEVNVVGTLKFSRSVNTRLKTSDNVMVMMGGFLDVGVASDYIPKNIKSELVWVLSQAQADAFVGGFDFNAADKGLWVMDGGRWEVHGSPLLRTWSKLSGDALAGASSVVVEGNVTDWPVGGTVVVSSTRVSVDSVSQNEIRTVSAVAGLADGKTRITFSSPLSFKHDGVASFRGEVALLSRNVLLKTELLGVAESVFVNDVSARKFAHTMFMPGSKGNVQYAEFKYLGHYGVLSRYAIHPHMMLEGSNGMVIRGTSGWYNGFRCVNMHASHGVLVEDNVCFSSFSSSYMVEIDRTGMVFNEDHAFVHNIGIGMLPIPFIERNNPDLAGEARRAAADYWPGTTGSEAFLGNVAVGDGGSGDWDTQGMYFNEIGRNMYGTGGVIPSTVLHNEFHSKTGVGIYSWPNVGNELDVVDPLIWRNEQGGMVFGAYVFNAQIHKAQLLENVGAGFEMWSVGSFVQDSLIVGHPTLKGPVALVTGVDNQGIIITAYNVPQDPNDGPFFARNTFRNIKAPAVAQAHNVCGDSSLEKRPIVAGGGGAGTPCGSTYVTIMGSTFENVDKTLDFGWQPNANAFWKVFDYPNPAEAGGHSDFVLFRKDQNVAANQGPISPKLITPQTFYSSYFDALVTPMSSLPASIFYDNLEPNRPTVEDPVDYNFSSVADYPPVVSLSVTLNGKTATLKATPSDDKAVSKVEFFVDWVKVGTKTAAPFELSVDLSNLPSDGGSGISSRKFAYIYARAFDGAYSQLARKSDYEQRAYSDVVEVGPEVLLQGQGLPQTPPVATLSINGGALFAGTNSVALSLACTASAGVKDVRYSNDGVFDSELAEAFATTKSWTLTPGDGLKTVWYQCTDTKSNSVVVTDTITLDTLAPSTSIVSVAGDVSSPYVDSVSSDGVSDVVVSGESGISCRWYDTDSAYTTSSGTSCTTAGTQATCTVSSAAGASLTKFVSCADSAGNGQTSANNLGVSWSVSASLAPVISNVKAAATDVSATITWDTNLAADSSVSYSETAASLDAVSVSAPIVSSSVLGAIGSSGSLASVTGAAIASFSSIPIMDMTTGQSYLGFSGGLYETGNNVPADHAAVGLTRAAKVQPLDTNGNPSAGGKIVLLSVGMSNTRNEWCKYGDTDAVCTAESFMGKAAADSRVNHATLTIVNGAQGGQDAVAWASSTAATYNSVSSQLSAVGLSDKQVQVIWLKQADKNPTVSLSAGSSADAYTLEKHMGNILRAIKIRYPNVQMVFISSRIYAGYTTGILNPEPYAYESGFSVKWLVQAQINQMRTGTIDSTAGDVSYSTVAPWVAWGPYVWADSTNPRSDGLTWVQADYASDFTHPAKTGVEKVSGKLMDLFLLSPYTKSWFAPGNSSSVLDITPPATSLVSVDGDTTSPYVDGTTDGTTKLVVSGESGMLCRWYDVDSAYSTASGAACTTAGSQATCTVPSLAGTSLTKFISCADSAGNGQSSSSNLDVSWTVSGISGVTVVYDGAKVTAHQLVLFGLTPGKTYYYKVTSCNTGLCSSSATLSFTATPPPVLAAADVNLDGKVNMADLLAVLADFRKPTAQLSNARTDINSDGITNIKDVGILLSVWTG